MEATDDVAVGEGGKGGEERMLGEDEWDWL